VKALANARGMAIELLDALRFFDELRIAQRARFAEQDFEKYYGLAFCRFELSRI
jgi:restriction system protein